MVLKGAGVDGPRSDGIALYFDLAEFADASTGLRSGLYCVKSTCLTTLT